jgi:hypothetical protein
MFPEPPISRLAVRPNAIQENGVPRAPTRQQPGVASGPPIPGWVLFADFLADGRGSWLGLGVWGTAVLCPYRFSVVS